MVVAARSGKPVRCAVVRIIAANSARSGWRALRGRTAPALSVPSALGGVHVDAHLHQSTFHHQLLEQAGSAAKGIAVRHEHGDEVQRLRVAQDLDDFVHGAEGDFAIGEVEIAGVAEDGRRRRIGALIDSTGSAKIRLTSTFR